MVKINNITRVSDITYQDVADYIRLTQLTDDDINTITTMINVSKTYIAGYTGLTGASLDNYPDFVIVVLVLCQDMWDNRTLYVDSNNINFVVQSILDMHAVNLL